MSKITNSSSHRLKKVHFNTVVANFFVCSVVLFLLFSCTDQYSSLSYLDQHGNLYQPLPVNNEPYLLSTPTPPYPCEATPGPGMDGFSHQDAVRAVIPDGELPSDDVCLVMQALPLGAPYNGLFEFTEDGPFKKEDMEFLKEEGMIDVFHPSLFAQVVPDAVQPVYPSGTGYNSEIRFQWKPAADASWYHIWVRDSGTATGLPRISQWIRAEDAGCYDEGSDMCEWNSQTTLPAGEMSWWIRPFNSAGEGNWSQQSRATLSQSTAAPPNPVKLAPNGPVDTNRPTFSWQAESTADEYYVYVRDSETYTSGSRIAIWITAEQAGCPDGTGTCSWTANTDLVDGDARWWLRARNNAGASTWGSPMDFSVALAPPPPPNKLSPNSEVGTNRPVFEWEAESAAAEYYVYVRDSETYTSGSRIAIWITAEQAGCPDGTGTCSWKANTDLAEGDARWWLRARNNAGASTWGSPMDFSVALAPPPPPNKLSPNSEVDTNRPVFEWEAEPTADEYYVYVRDSETYTSGSRIAIWITAEQAGCPDGTGTCSWTANENLVQGDARWWLRARNNAGASTWGSPMDFSVTLSAPPTPVKLSPNGEVNTKRPAFQWEAEASAEEYYVFVRDSETLSGGARIAIWITAAQAGCAGGTGTCSWTANTDLSLGDARWWLRSRNSAGTSTWGSPMEFEVVQSQPSVPNKISPQGTISTNKPLFQWDAEPVAEEYLIYIRDSQTPSGFTVTQILSKAQAGCGSGTGTCSWTPGTSIIQGEAQWWLRARNDAGTSGWGTPMVFEVDVTLSNYTFNLTISDAESTMEELAFGVRQTAQSVAAPPPPPEGALHAYFKLGSDDLFQDFRGNIHQNQTWRLFTTIGSGSEITLTWSRQGFHSMGTMTLRDTSGNILARMRQTNTFTFSPAQYPELRIEYRMD